MLHPPAQVNQGAWRPLKHVNELFYWQPAAQSGECRNFLWARGKVHKVYEFTRLTRRGLQSKRTTASLLI